MRLLLRPDERAHAETVGALHQFVQRRSAHVAGRAGQENRFLVHRSTLSPEKERRIRGSGAPDALLYTKRKTRIRLEPLCE